MTFSVSTVILVTIFLISMFVFFVAYRWFVAPLLLTRPATDHVIALLAPNMIRHVGASTLSVDIVSPEFARKVGAVVTLGDLSLLALSMTAIYGIRHEWRYGYHLAWVVVAVTLLHGLAFYGAAVRFYPSLSEHIGQHWYVGTFTVPLLLVSTFVLMTTLIRRRDELRREL